MKKSLLLMALAVVALVGCDAPDTTPTVFQYEEYAYVVSMGADQKPAGLLALEVTYKDENEVMKTETVAANWTRSVPAKKGFKMEMSAKVVLAAGQTRPTSGNEVNVSISVGISGAKAGKPAGGFLSVQMYSHSAHSPNAYTKINSMLDSGDIKTVSYEIQPILEPGMGE